jgi:rhodanese-related sulfurtransferase
MPLKTITPAQAKALVDKGAKLIDIREPDEHARARIAGAGNMPLSQLAPFGASGAHAVIYHCKSGGRTVANAVRLSEVAPCKAYLLEGGIDAWRKAGLPVVEDRGQPLELMRQVQIAAGGLVLLGVLLGLVLTPIFIGLSAFVGAGLIFAGVTGWCGMARMLASMPWNRPPAGH